MVLGLEMIEAANLDKRQRLSGPSMVMYLNKERLLSVMVFLEGFATDHKRGFRVLASDQHFRQPTTSGFQPGRIGLLIGSKNSHLAYRASG